jgi:glutathione S-transferase
MGDDFILHHYDNSPFSEKVRLAFGLKGLAWRSVIQPTIMPKPDLIPLTGGYRRIPVLQIGADIICDTQLILAEIEARAPHPALGGGLGFAINWWADRLFFQSSVAIIFGEIGHLTPEAFIKDREQLSGQRFNIEAMKAASGPMRGQWRAQAAWIEAELAASGADWLGGAAPNLADVAAYMNPWFVENALPSALPKLLADFDRTQAWQARVKAIGHGHRSELTPAAALDIARAAEPGEAVVHDGDDPLGLEPGAAAFVMADDYGRDRIEGVLVAANAERIVLAREDRTVGLTHLHVPRTGYFAGPA